jgi:hypothetical protein
MPRLNRRQFLHASAAGSVLLTATAAAHAHEAKLPQRTLGKTGVQVPILGLGTVALGSLASAKEAESLVNAAIDLGVTYIDTAPGKTSIAAFTGYGKAHAYLHGVLKERRKEVFLATKTLETDSDKALSLVKKNLQELGIDQVDLTYSHSIGHAMYKLEDLTGPNGTMAGLEKAKKEGLTRFVGITGHNRPEKFAEVIKQRDIDAMMNAVNIVDRHTYAFEDVTWPLARQKNIGLVAMKVFGGSVTTRPCKMPPELRELSLRYCLSVPGVALAVIGMATKQELEQNVAWAKSFKPMTAEEMKETKKETVALARKWGVHLDKLDTQGETTRKLVNT